MAVITKAKLRGALIRHDGVQARVAEEFGVSRSAISQRVRADPKLQALVHDHLEGIKDLAEGTIFLEVKAEAAAALAAAKIVEEGGTPTTIEPKTSKWFLERKAKDRGWAGSVGVRLDDDAIADFVDQLAEKGGAEALRKLAGGG